MSSFRAPQNLGAGLRFETGESVLHHEIAQEQAASLGRMGRKCEIALAALRDQAGEDKDGKARAEALAKAADAVWCFLLQREVMG
ncbi:MAG: hypothetical protein JSS35_15710, partial [Proteobacteria bacterium]|nr:hypothetical protein [Pseudomonadota bacterium]